MVRSLLRLFEVLVQPHVGGELKEAKDNKNLKNWIVVSAASILNSSLFLCSFTLSAIDDCIIPRLRKLKELNRLDIANFLNHLFLPWCHAT